MFATLMVTSTPRVDAHTPEVLLIDCLGWSVDLWVYDEPSDNSVEIWVDDVKIVDVADFGQEYHTSGSWDPLSSHSLRVKVVAGDGPTNPNWSFDRTLTSTACPTPAIDIEKATNGEDADSVTGPEIEVGATVTWTYVVTNTGDADLADVAVTDDKLGAICTVGDLAVDASATCTATGTAALGQYANEGTVTGTDPRAKVEVTDTDPSHYIGVPSPVPAIDIEKFTNGSQADEPTDPDVPEIETGATVTWRYDVTNTGDVALTDVTVADDKEGFICTIGTLAVGATDSCTATGIAEARLYANIGTVVGFYGEVSVTDSDPSHYTFPSDVGGTSQLGDTVWLDANKNGVQDSGEQGLEGACVDLKDSDGTVIGTLTTGTVPWVGFYKFVGLDAGVYTAAIDMTCVKSSYELTHARIIHRNARRRRGVPRRRLRTLRSTDDNDVNDCAVYNYDNATHGDAPEYRHRFRSTRGRRRRTADARRTRHPGDPEATHHRLTGTSTIEMSVGRPTCRPTLVSRTVLTRAQRSRLGPEVSDELLPRSQVLRW